MRSHLLLQCTVLFYFVASPIAQPTAPAGDKKSVVLPVAPVHANLSIDAKLIKGNLIKVNPTTLSVNLSIPHAKNTISTNGSHPAKAARGKVSQPTAITPALSKLFLTPNPEVSLRLALDVTVPTHIASVFQQRKYEVEELSHRLSSVAVAMKQLEQLYTQADSAIESKFEKMNTLASNFKTFYEANEKASRGKTLDDKKIDRATLLPLLEVSKSIQKQKLKLLTASKSWQSGVVMNTGERLALRRIMVRIQRQIGLLMVELTRLPVIGN